LGIVVAPIRALFLTLSLAVISLIMKCCLLGVRDSLAEVCHVFFFSFIVVFHSYFSPSLPGAASCSSFLRSRSCALRLASASFFPSFSPVLLEESSHSLTSIWVFLCQRARLSVTTGPHHCLEPRELRRADLLYCEAAPVSRLSEGELGHSYPEHIPAVLSQSSLALSLSL
jgi:hypothetical protein